MCLNPEARLGYWSLEKLPTRFSASASISYLFIIPGSVTPVHEYRAVMENVTDSQNLPPVLVPVHPYHGQDHRWRFRVVSVPSRVDREVPVST